MPRTNQRGFLAQALRAALKVVLTGSRLGKPGVFNRKMSTNHVLSVVQLVPSIEVWRLAQRKFSWLV